MDHPDGPSRPPGRNSDGRRGEVNGRDAPRRVRRRGWVWLLLAAALAVLAVGVVFGEGVLIAAGLVCAALAVMLFDRSRAEHDDPPEQ